jgi:hypothetical protein
MIGIFLKNDLVKISNALNDFASLDIVFKILEQISGSKIFRREIVKYPEKVYFHIDQRYCVC